MGNKTVPQDCKVLQSLRKTLDLSQAQVAERLGVSSQAVSQYELGQRALPVRMAWRYLQLCDKARPTLPLDVVFRLHDIYPLNKEEE